MIAVSGATATFAILVLLLYDARLGLVVSGGLTVAVVAAVGALRLLRRREADVRVCIGDTEVHIHLVNPPFDKHHTEKVLAELADYVMQQLRSQAPSAD